ncbi:unnamed protein product [Microthlaspi erraticum]|uniref:Retrovirus-related Pol polyprotein from transposon TNT 1-94-like beta-barrel domain-containing protein n=1 Tax=Microthlaspi erraticum TaxID=1685480 RepID=A0A6D2HTK7_9BRAS|nr:unnamed protein product [Microthlaspi erraticum]
MGKDKFLHTPPQASRSKLNQRSSNGSATSVARWATKLMFAVAKLVQVKTKGSLRLTSQKMTCVLWDMFSTYQKCNNGERLLMGNTGSSKIEGHGKVVLKMTSGKEITLQNVKHVTDMRKNLISGTLMSKAGFATNFESDKLVLKKHGVYLGKGYVKDGLVKMCVMPVIRN